MLSEKMVMGNERMKGLLADLTAHKITLDQFLLACAEWTAEEIGAFNFKPLPVRPKAMDKYNQVPEEDRYLLTSEFYEANPEILNYVRLEQKITWENKALYGWLLECRKLLLGNDKVEQARVIDQRIAEREEVKT
jgi:hypothetical protein